MLTRTLLNTWFAEFNTKVFNGELRRVPLYAEYVPPGTWGFCYFGKSLHIKDTLSEHDARRTLLHEMIHLWQEQKLHPMNHGQEFVKWGRKCRSLTGLDV